MAIRKILIRFYYNLASTALLRLSCRVLDSRPKGRGFEPHRRHCVVSLSNYINPSLVLVQPRKTRHFITERLLIRRKETNQTNKLRFYYALAVSAAIRVTKLSNCSGIAVQRNRGFNNKRDGSSTAAPMWANFNLLSTKSARNQHFSCDET